MPIKTIFLDRDGVINKEVSYLHKISDFRFIDGVFECCQYFENLGFKIIVVSNQSGIARGYYAEEDFKILTNWMINQFLQNRINILDVFHCPHSPIDNCNCRKPRPGMLLDAKEKYNINMKESWLIGDKESDIIAANKAGVENTVLVRSGHKIQEKNSDAKFIVDSINDSINLVNSSFRD